MVYGHLPPPPSTISLTFSWPQTHQLPCCSSKHANNLFLRGTLSPDSPMICFLTFFRSLLKCHLVNKAFWAILEIWQHPSYPSTPTFPTPSECHRAGTWFAYCCVLGSQYRAGYLVVSQSMFNRISGLRILFFSPEKVARVHYFILLLLVMLVFSNFIYPPG